MRKSIFTTISIIPAVAIGYTVLYLNMLYGLGSAWLRHFQVADYFNIAMRLMPEVLVSISAVGLMYLFMNPRHEPADAGERFSSRTAVGNQKMLDRVFIFGPIWLLIPFSFFLLNEGLKLSLFLLLTLFTKQVLDFLNVASGNRLVGWLGENPIPKLMIGLAFLGSIFILSTTADRLRNDIRQFEREHDCFEQMCVGDYFFVERISSGIIGYKNERLYLLSDQGEIVTERAFSVQAEPIGCSLGIVWLEQLWALCYPEGRGGLGSISEEVEAED